MKVPAGKSLTPALPLEALPREGPSPLNATSKLLAAGPPGLEAGRRPAVVEMTSRPRAPLAAGADSSMAVPTERVLGQATHATAHGRSREVDAGLFHLAIAANGSIQVAARSLPGQSARAHRAAADTLTLCLSSVQANPAQTRKLQGGVLVQPRGPAPLARWISVSEPGIAMLALAAHREATPQSLSGPPVGLLTGVQAGFSGPSWRVHNGTLHAWAAATPGLQAQWRPVPLKLPSATGVRSAPERVEMLGLQPDHAVWARAGDHLLKLGDNHVQAVRLPQRATSRALQITADGHTVLALDDQGRLHRPTEPASEPVPIAMTKADGTSTSARPKSFALVPHSDSDMVLLGDDQRLYHVSGLNTGTPLQAHRIDNPLGDGSGWRAVALGLAPSEAPIADAGATPARLALHAIYQNSEGRRASLRLEEGRWRPQWNLDLPLRLLQDSGLQQPQIDARQTTSIDGHLQLGVSPQQQVYRKATDGAWCELLQADGQPLSGVHSLKLGPLGLSDGKKVYARQDSSDGRTRIVELQMLGRELALPASLPTAEGDIAHAAEQPFAVPTSELRVQPREVFPPHAALADFAVAGNGTAYGLVDGQVLQRPAGADALHALPPAPGGGAIQSIAVSSDRHRLFSLVMPAPGPADDTARLMRYQPPHDDAGHGAGQWIDTQLDWAGQVPQRLQTGRFGTLEVEVAGQAEPLKVGPPSGPEGDAATPAAPYRLLAPTRQALFQGIAEAAPHRLPLKVPLAEPKGRLDTGHQIEVSGVALDGRERLGVPSLLEQAKARGQQASRVLNSVAGAAGHTLNYLGDAMGWYGGRADMQAEREALALTHREAEAMLSQPVALPPLVRAHEAEPGAVATAATLCQQAIGDVQRDLQRLAVRRGVLNIDLSPTRQHLASESPAPDSRVLQLRTYWNEVLHAADPVAPSGPANSREALLGEDTRASVRQIVDVLTQLSIAGIEFHDSGDRHGAHDTAVLEGAVLRQTLGFARAAELASRPPGGDAARAQAQALRAGVQGDKALALSRYGFSNWQGAERFWEVASTVKRELLQPGSHFNNKFLDVVGLPRGETNHAALAVGYAEALKKLPSRSTAFALESKGFTLNLTANLKQVRQGSLSFFTSVGADRSLGVGVERTAGEHFEEGPLVVFFVQQQKAGATGGAFLGSLPDQLSDMASAGGSLSLSESGVVGGGCAVLIPPEHIDEFARRWTDPNVDKFDPTSLLDLGMNGGAIGLEMHEHAGQLSLSGALQAGVEWAYGPHVPSLPGTATASVAVPEGGSASQPAGVTLEPTAPGQAAVAASRQVAGTALRARAEASATLAYRQFDLQLDHGWNAGQFGIEKQGGAGYSGSAEIAARLQGAVNPYLGTALEGSVGVISRMLASNLAGLRLDVNAMEQFKRTVDLVPAQRVAAEQWQAQFTQASAVFGQADLPDIVNPQTNPQAAPQAPATALRELVARVSARRPDGRYQVPATNEVDRAGFVHSARALLVQDELARQQRGMIAPGAKIEINLPGTASLDRGTGNTTRSHLGLRQVMAHAAVAREQIPGGPQLLAQMGKAAGANEVRVVFGVNPAAINDLNERLGRGELNWEQAARRLASDPRLYQLQAIVTKDTAQHQSTLAASAAPVLGNSDEVTHSHDVFTTQVSLRWDLDNQPVRMDALPGAQRALGQLYADMRRSGLSMMEVSGEPLPPQTPTKSPRGPVVDSPFR